MAKDTKKQSGSGQRNKTRQLEATAKAKEAEARTREIEARLETARLEADAKKRADEAAARSQKQGFDTAVLAGTYAAGLVGGKMAASAIDKKVTASVAVKNAALKDLAKVTTGLTEKAGGDTPAGKRATAKLNATVKVADKTKLTSVSRGKAGLITAAGLVALGMTTRGMASETADETTKTILTAAGTAEVVAGATVLYSEAAARAAPKALPDVKALAAIEQGRAIAQKGTPAAPAPEPKAKAPPAAKAPGQPGAKKAKAASKKMVSGMTKVGGEVVESTAKAAGKTVAKAGLRALGPVAIAAATVAAVTGSAQAGESTAQNIAKGVVAAADAAAFGVPGMIADSVKNRETIKYDAKEAARQANAASAEKKLASGAKLTRAEEVAMQEKAANAGGDGLTGDDVVRLALNGAVIGAGATFISDGNRAARYGRGALRVIGNRAAGAMLIALGTAQAIQTVKDRMGGKAYLNDQAKKKAESAPAVTPTMAGRMVAQAMTADGQTEAYQRRTKTGKTVTVQGYRTPTR